MNGNLSKNEIESNQRLVSALKRKYQSSIERINQLSRFYDVKGDSHFRHITNNLLTLPRGILKFMEEKLKEGNLFDGDIDYLIKSNQNLNHLNKYLSLGFANPDFLQGEVYSSNPFFRLGKKSIYDSTNYVNIAEKSLNSLQRKRELRGINSVSN